MVKDRQRLKELIGVVFEEQNLYERLSASNNLRFSCWLYNVPLSRINAVLDLVHLIERSKEPVRTFSNGMKQRLMIARALLHEPPVLFLDEPTRGLDPIAAREVRLAIEQLSQNGKTILLTTYLLEEADQLCGRVALIVNGHILADVIPVSFADILVGKLLVVLVFQLAITSVVLAILGSFTGAVPLVVLYMILGACFSLSSGLLFGSLFNTVQAAGTVSGLVSFVFILSGIFVGQLGELLGNGPVLQIARFIPTYYLADGVVNASQNLGTLGSNLLDIGIILDSTVLFLAISSWALRRQSTVLAVI